MSKKVSIKTPEKNRVPDKRQHLKSTAGPDARKRLKRLLDQYAALPLKTPERDWTDKEVDEWEKGMEILTAQGLEGGLLPYEEWKELLETKPWSINHARCANARLGFLQRILAAQETIIGIEHPDTLCSMNNLAFLMSNMGHSDAAEAIYRRALEASERAFGAEHQLTIRIVENLATLLFEKLEFKKAEPFMRRAMDASLRTPGPDDPKTKLLVKNVEYLAEANKVLGDAEELFKKKIEEVFRNMNKNKDR